MTITEAFDLMVSLYAKGLIRNVTLCDDTLSIEYAAEFLESLYLMGKIAWVKWSQHEDVITVSVRTWQGDNLGVAGQIGRESPWVQRMIREVLRCVVMDDLGMFPPEGYE